MFNIKKKSAVEKMINSAISNNEDGSPENTFFKNSSRKEKDTSVNVVIEAKVIDSFCEASYNEGRYVSFLRQNIIPFINALGQKVNSCTFKAALDLLCGEDSLMMEPKELDVLHRLQFENNIEHPCIKDVLKYYEEQGVDIKPDFSKCTEYGMPVDIIKDVLYYDYTVQIEYSFRNKIYHKNLEIKKTSELIKDVIRIDFNSESPEEISYVQPDDPVIKKISEALSKVDDGRLYKLTEEYFR